MMPSGLRSESFSRSALTCLQAERLKALLAEIVPRNGFWTSKFEAARVDVARVQSLPDLQKLPFTTKAELLADQQAHPPYGSNLTYEIGAYSRLHQTSGTTGVPLRWLDTPQSWDGLMQCWSQLFALLGLAPEDRLFFPFSFGPFLGFWAGFEGANRLGNLCLPGGGLSSSARLKLMLENQATIVCCTPTYALRLAEVAAEQQVDLAGSPVRGLLVAGEPGGNIPSIRRKIEEAWGARVFDHWGMTELGPIGIETANDPGGLCLLETECIAEIIDPSSGAPVVPGEEGELVITGLGRWGSPLIRYRTGDRVRADLRPNPAVRWEGQERDLAFLRLEGGIRGRLDDMLTIRGNNFYPSALEDIIRQFDAVAEYRITVRSVKSMQHLTIEIEPVASTNPSEADRLAKQIADLIKVRWNFQAEVTTVPFGSLPRSELKGRRFFRIE